MRYLAAGYMMDVDVMNRRHLRHLRHSRHSRHFKIEHLRVVPCGVLRRFVISFRQPEVSVSIIYLDSLIN